MKTIFHVGHSKTGSTTLQSIFLASKEQLAAKKVLYPSNPNGRYNNHKLLFADLMEPHKVPRHIIKNYTHDELAAARRGLEDSIRSEIADLRPECLVLSSETRFGVFSDQSRKTFRKVLQGFGSDDIDIVAYVRMPSGWYLSALNQRMRRSASVKPPRVLNLYKPITQFYEDFGKEHVHVLPFAREVLKGGDITEDFCARFLGDYGVTLETLAADDSANQSFSNEAMDIVRRFRAQFLPGKDDKFVSDGETLLGLVMQAESGLKMPKPRLRPGLADYLDYNSRDLVDLRDKYDFVLPGYDYERAEKGKFTKLGKKLHALEDLVDIDREAQAELISTMAGYAWIHSHSERANWFDSLYEQIGLSTAKARFFKEKSKKPGISKENQTIGVSLMNEQTESTRSPEEQAERDLAVALGRAIFREEKRGEFEDKETRQQAWIEGRRAYIKQGRAVLKQLRKKGFELVKSEEEVA